MTGRRVLVVGAGTMGRQHANAVKSVGDCIVAVVDPVLDRASSIESSAQVFSTVSEAADVVEDMDSAIVATPSAQHLADCVQLLRRGFEVLVEKPHRIPGQDPSELIGALQKGGRLYVAMSTRHWPGIREASEAVASGELGEIVTYFDRMQYRLEQTSLPPWYFSSAISGGGVLTTNGVHAFDRARTVLGSDLELVVASRRVFDPSHDSEDHASVFAWVGNTAAYFDISWLPFDPVETGLVVTGSRGVAKVGMDGSWSIVTGSWERSGPALDITSDPFRYQWTSFCNQEPGFDLFALEPTLSFIEKIYREVELG